MTTADVKWLQGSTVERAWWTHPQALPAGRELVYMVRGSNGKVRFYAPGPRLSGSGLRQVGIECDSIVAAHCWAWWHQWAAADVDDEGNHRCTVEQWNTTRRKGTDDLLVHVGCSCAWCAGFAKARVPLPPASLSSDANPTLLVEALP